MERVVIIGTSCSGKSQLAKLLSTKLGVSHIELDDLHWLPNWKERPDKEFSDLGKISVSGEQWVIDGNYRVIQEMIWSRATTIIWLNYSFPLVLFRAIKRTIVRASIKEKSHTLGYCLVKQPVMPMLKFSHRLNKQSDLSAMSHKGINKQLHRNKFRYAQFAC